MSNVLERRFNSNRESFPNDMDLKRMESDQILQNNEKLRILVATEYLPPYISGIANRCKNLINGYREKGHSVTVFSCQNTDCDFVVPSLPNPFYMQQRLMNI